MTLAPHHGVHEQHRILDLYRRPKLGRRLHQAGPPPLSIRPRPQRDYLTGGPASLLPNYLYSALAGTTWFLQFFFYGMGTTKMGRYDFSSWTIHMAFIIVFSNLWGLLFLEWKGTSRRTHLLIRAGIVVLIVSTLVVGLGNYLEASKG